ncbi:MAG: hypothetical protein GC145_18960 [Caulobacter sp.]|nr:hypothetical protein [Caulobacter sp.]
MTRGLIVAAGLLLAALSSSWASAQGADPLNRTFGRAVGACRAMVEAKLEPSAVAAEARREGLSTTAVPPPGLESTLFPESGHIDWLGMTAPRGKVLLAIDRRKSTCTVFLLGVPGRPYMDSLAAGLTGWKEYPLNDPIRRLLYLPLSDGQNLVFDMHDGGNITQASAIGALIQIRIIRG